MYSPLYCALYCTVLCRRFPAASVTIPSPPSQESPASVQLNCHFMSDCPRYVECLVQKCIRVFDEMQSSDPFDRMCTLYKIPPCTLYSQQTLFPTPGHPCVCCTGGQPPPSNTFPPSLNKHEIFYEIIHTNGDPVNMSESIILIYNINVCRSHSKPTLPVSPAFHHNQ